MVGDRSFVESPKGRRLGKEKEGDKRRNFALHIIWPKERFRKGEIVRGSKV